MNGQQYVAQMNPYMRHVHDLDNENRNCLIDEIIRTGQDRPYTRSSKHGEMTTIRAPSACRTPLASQRQTPATEIVAGAEDDSVGAPGFEAGTSCSQSNHGEH